MKNGATPSTAAVVVLLGQAGVPVEPSVGSWLLGQCQPSGGFLAVPGALVPDLLSTATALHALVRMKVPLDHIRERCIDFVDSLWSADGGFHGTWADRTLDCEYTYYGLGTVGLLALEAGRIAKCQLPIAD